MLEHSCKTAMRIKEWHLVQLIQGNGCGAKMPEKVIENICWGLNLVLSESGENYD